MSRPVHYVDCDVPEGMTLSAYRAAKCPSPRRRRSLVAVLRRRAQPVAQSSGSPVVVVAEPEASSPSETS